jgi:hypothetical protein
VHFPVPDLTIEAETAIAVAAGHEIDLLGQDPSIGCPQRLVTMSHAGE